MKRVIAIAFVLISPVSFVAASAESMFRANLERTGVYQTQSIQRLHGVKWKFKTERIIDAWFSCPTLSHGMVSFGSDDSYLYAQSALTADLKWKSKTGDVVCSSPAVAGGEL